MRFFNHRALSGSPARAENHSADKWNSAREMGWQERADKAHNRRELEHRSAGKALGLVQI